MIGLLVSLFFMHSMQIVASDDQAAVTVPEYTIKLSQFMGGWHISAKKDNEQLGYVRFYVDNNIGEIERLWVKKDVRKKGLGSELGKKAIAKLIEFNCTAIKVKPNPFEAEGNFAQEKQKLVDLYTRYGFKQKHSGDEFLWLTLSSQEI